MTDEERLIGILRASPTLVRVMEGLRDLALPDWRLVSGCLYQTAWNALTGRGPDYGLKDYDAVYFDPDTAYEAEDVHIKRAAAAFEAPLGAMVEVRNQARVHLWFEQKFGEPYAPLTRTDEALERFVCPAFAVGARLEADGCITLAAPFGLDDLFAMRLRPNPRRPINPAGFARICASAQGRWPELTVTT
ncbi:MAG: nucleotidyltransferase family protein [Caulobacteraceae bacterium]